jgi:hypothetical protein
MLFQKRMVSTEFDIYVFIAINAGADPGRAPP